MSAKNDGAEDASLQKRQFTITTAVAGIAALAAVGALVIGAVADWDKLFGPPEPTVSMKHGDFSKLPYGQQLDLCIPYIRENIDKGYRGWRSALKEWPQSATDEIARLNASNPDGQALINFHMTVREIARSNDNYDLAKNLISCAYSTSDGKVGFDPYAEVAAGNAKPYPVYAAVSESKLYTQGTFNGFAADDRPSKIVEERSTAKNSNFRIQVGYTLVSGSATSGNEIWVTTATVRPDNGNWIPDLKTVDLGDNSGHP
jgi:hypothetical protein